MTGWVADVSYGHDSVPGATLAANGCVGVIAYAGCNDGGKNCTAANVADWRGHGLMVGLVIENEVDAVLQGAPRGTQDAQALLVGARAVGYDMSCVLFSGADFNSQPSQYQVIGEYMAAFAAGVGWAGFYGNSGTIDYLASAGHARTGWQSESASFSNGLSVNAHLQQNFNDPRAADLPIDVNDIRKIPIGLMGENTDMPLSADDLSKISTLIDQRLNNYFANGEGNPTTGRVVQAIKNTYPTLNVPGDVWDHPVTSTDKRVNAAAASVVLADTRTGVMTANADAAALAVAVNANAAAIAKIQTAGGGGLTIDQIASQLAIAKKEQ